MQPAIVLDDVTKRFGQTTAVEALSLQVPQGAIYGFIGPNGSGKTTTLRMIMNILLPDSGSVDVLGDRGTSSARDRVGTCLRNAASTSRCRSGACSPTTAS